MDSPTLILLMVVALAAVVVWIDSRLLQDLARTPDGNLRYFDRRIWALIIVLSFPIGPMLYLRFAKYP